MSIDYTSMIYGNRNAEQPRRATGQGTSSVNYDELYRQANQGNFSNMTANISGSAAGSADFLADYARRNNQVQQAGMTPISFNPLLGPEGLPTPTAVLPGNQKSIAQMQDEARARYEATRLEQIDIARQGTLRTGADQYSQARMAMEQQMALSDTRGLTAGAREGAQQTLSATQQVALNQIESGTLQRLDQLDNIAAQMPLEAIEFAQKELELISQSDRRFIDMNSPDPKVASAAIASLFEYTPEEKANLERELARQAIGSEGYNLALEQGLSKQLEVLSQDATFLNTAMNVGLATLAPAIGANIGRVVVGKGGIISTYSGMKFANTAIAAASKGLLGKLGITGAGLAAKGGTAALIGAKGAALLSNPVGWAILAIGVGFAAYGLYTSVQDEMVKRQDPATKARELRTIVSEGSADFTTQGYTPAEIEGFWRQDLNTRGYTPREIEAALGAIRG